MSRGGPCPALPWRACGIAVVEFTLVLPILLVMLFGVIDLGRAILIHQVLVNISREAANLASRGTPMDQALTAVVSSAAPLDMAVDGYIILTEVTRSSAAVVTVKKQIAAGGRAHASRVGSVIGGPASLPSSTVPIPPVGQLLYAAEVYYRWEAITPLGNLLDLTDSDTFYDAAFF